MFEKVTEVIAATLNCEISELKLETTLEADLGADSLDAVELNMALEEEFGIKIADEELADLKTVADIVACVESKV